MAEILQIGKKDVPVRGPEATVEVVRWLREKANELENGKLRPAHKAVLVMYQDCGEQFRTIAVCCNATLLERIGIMSVASHDIVDCTADDE